MRAYRTFQQASSAKPGSQPLVKKLAYAFIGLGSFYFNNLYAIPSQAATLNYSSGVGTPVTTTTADSLEKGRWSFSGRSEYYRLNPLSDQALLDDPISESQLALLVNYFMINYGITDNLTMGATLPYTRNYQLRTAFPDEEGFFSQVVNLGDVSGIADANLFAFWHVLDDNKFPLSTALVFGVNAPTGRTNAMTSYGVPFAAADQPGSGSWNPFAGLIISKKLGEFSLSADCIYTHTTQGIQETLLGKIVDYNFAVVYPLVTQNNKEKKLNYSIDGIVELNGEYLTQDKIAGINDPNTGGNSLFLSPGFRINLGDSVSFYFSAGFPVTETLHGTQVKSKYGIIGGIDLIL
ncbi:TPA: transporter [Legionella feeleii]